MDLTPKLDTDPRPFRITITFTRTTHESREAGDSSSTGWHDEEGYFFEDVEDAADWIASEGAFMPSSSQWHQGVWYSTEPQTIDYATGEDEYLSYHVDATPENQELLALSLQDRGVDIGFYQGPGVDALDACVDAVIDHLRRNR